MILYTIKEVFSIKESELYEPIKLLLEAKGFTVRGEVKGCDIAVLADDELWIIELKRHLSIKLLYQAMSRLSITPFVFVAVPRPKRLDGDFKLAKKLLKKLELGLIIVAADSPKPYAEIALYPEKFQKGKATQKSAAIRKEAASRKQDTPGGSTGITITSAYRERCIKIACILKQTDPLSPIELIRQYNCEKDAGSILQKNYYGWFTRIARGRYTISPLGLQFLKEDSDNLLIREYSDLV